MREALVQLTRRKFPLKTDINAVVDEKLVGSLSEKQANEVFL